MGKPFYRREKLCAWMVKETFQTFPPEELELFVDNQSIFEEQIRCVDWEMILDDDPDVEKTGDGVYLLSPKEEVA